jgi:hypothetical protein
VDLRDGVALETVLDRAGVEAEDVGEDVFGVGAVDREVHPHEAVVTGERCRQLVRGAALGARSGHEPHVHGTTRSEQLMDTVQPSERGLGRHPSTMLAVVRAGSGGP